MRGCAVPHCPGLSRAVDQSSGPGTIPESSESSRLDLRTPLVEAGDSEAGCARLRDMWVLPGHVRRGKPAVHPTSTDTDRFRNS